MSIEKLVSLFSVESYTGKNFARIFCYIAILIVIITTFGLQNGIVGWEPGYDDLQPKHHGWVSSQGLAIISTATFENHFVGYAVAYKDDQNKMHYDYFDRYPVFFSALFNQILSLYGKLSDKVHIAKQGMNLIFLCTLIVAFLLVDKLTGNKLLALTAVLLAFSNPFLLFYKDMVHFDQPALFGCLLLTYAITLYKIDGLKIPLYISTFVAIGLGRGYASYPILILWLVLEAFVILKSDGLDLSTKVKSIIRHPAFLLLVIGIIWGASLLSYNVVVEANKSDIPIKQTSILLSARKRLSLNPEFNQENEDIINWRDFSAVQVNRIIQWSFPVNKADFGFWGNLFVLGLMFAVTGIFVRKQTVEKRIIYLILVFSGFAWLFPLRNLAAFHDYTAMYYIGLPLVFYSSIFTLLNPSRKIMYCLAVLSVVVYVAAIVQVKDLHEARVGNASQYTYDFEHILEKIDGQGKNIYLREEIPYAPYAPLFYLSEDYLSPIGLADYVISRDKKFLPNNLTPDNTVVFLFKK
jgi:hypothetical protein